MLSGGGPGSASTASTWTRAIFYSDSHDDLELLQRVGHPRPLNPKYEPGRDSRASRLAGAPLQRAAVSPAVLRFRPVGRGDGFAGPFRAGRPAHLGADRLAARSAQFRHLGMFADVSSALIGLNLVGQRRGEPLGSAPGRVRLQPPEQGRCRHHRASLLRRDIAGVGKKEIKQTRRLSAKPWSWPEPCSSTAKMPPAPSRRCKPLVDAMRNERKSVAIAPEGTRTVSPKLAPFKKGPFHLAIQAGVPVVPMVIHNAGDVAPKGDFVFRPATVEVDVLPPVDTSDWAAETIEEHVAEIRRMFQVKLGQEQKQAESPLVAEPQAPAPAAPPAAKPAVKKAVKKASRKKKPAKKAARKTAPARKKPARTEPAAAPESRPPDRQVQAPGKKVLKKKALKKRALKKKKVKIAPKKAAARKAPRKKPLRKKVLGKKQLTGDTGA